MSALAFFGFAIALVLAPVIPFIIARWVRNAWHAAKALRVLSRERRTGETLYDCAESIAGDAHNWRGLVDPSLSTDAQLRKDRLLLNVSNKTVREVCGTEDVRAFVEKYGFKKSVVAPQPPPQNSEGPALWSLIISELGDSETDRLVAIDMQQRHEFGVAKYGVPLVASNGRDHLADAYQEALDGVVYLRAAIENRLRLSVEDTNVRELNGLHQLYVDLLDIAKELRELIRVRDGR